MDELLRWRYPFLAKAGVGGSIESLLDWELSSSCAAREELMLSIWRLWRLGVLGNPLLPLPLSSDHDRDPRSVPPSDTESTVDSCELH